MRLDPLSLFIGHALASFVVLCVLTIQEIGSCKSMKLLSKEMKDKRDADNKPSTGTVSFSADFEGEPFDPTIATDFKRVF